MVRDAPRNKPSMTCGLRKENKEVQENIQKKRLAKRLGTIKGTLTTELCSAVKAKSKKSVAVTTEKANQDWYAKLYSKDGEKM